MDTDRREPRQDLPPRAVKLLAAFHKGDGRFTTEQAYRLCNLASCYEDGFTALGLTREEVKIRCRGRIIDEYLGLRFFWIPRGKEVPITATDGVKMHAIVRKIVTRLL